MLQCLRCGYRGSGPKRCPRCGFPLIPEPQGRFRIVEGEPTIWRYGPTLGVSKGVTLGEGMTPLRKIGGVAIKDESRNPTGSIMDRGSAVLASVYQGARAAVAFSEDFTLSIATYFSARGITVEVYMDPTSANYADFILLASLPNVEIRFGVAPKVDVEYGEPYFLAGIKTLAYELFEGARKMEAVAVPLEKGYIALAIYQAFRELEEEGYTAPRLLLAKYREASVSEIARWLIDKGAELIEVDSVDAVRAAVELAREGIYAKPLSAMAYVAAAQEKNAVAVITGTGLRRPYLPRRGELGGLQAQIIEVLRRRGEMTAYQIWDALGRRPTLRGVYKALSSLAARGIVAQSYQIEGKRRIKRFKLNSGK